VNKRTLRALAVPAATSILFAGCSSAFGHGADPANGHATKIVVNDRTGGVSSETASTDPRNGQPLTVTAKAAKLAAQAWVTSVRPDDHLNNLFANYGNSGKGWTGGDGGASAQLPDGRIFWAFSDTWLGPVFIEGLRAPNTAFVNNVAVIQNGDQFNTIYGGSLPTPQPFMSSGALPGAYYWNNGAIVSNNTLYVSYSGYYVRRQVAFAFNQLDTVFAAFSLPDLSLKTVTPVALGPNVKWGISMMNDGGYTYIYGAGLTNTKYSLTYMYVARAPENNVLGPWQYFNGTTWSDNPADVAPLTSVVKDPYSVAKINGVYVLFTMEAGPFSNAVQAYFGPTPVGPFSNGQNIYSTAVPQGAYGLDTSGLYEYGAYVHPAFTKGSTFVISYQVNAKDPPSWIYARVIRPVYLDVTISFDRTRNHRTSGQSSP
jgi:hypothetical protein